MTEVVFTFSTLACPEWPVAAVIERAAAYGYAGLEWRGGAQGHLPPDLPAAERQHVRQRVADAGLFSLAVTAYTSFTSPQASERAASLDDLRRHLDLAADLGARYVRAFLGELPPGTTFAAAYPGIIDCLHAAAEYAEQAGVAIAVEPHDDFVRATSVAPILAAVPQPSVRAIWDIGNAHAAGEVPAEGWAILGPRLAYVQVKDGTGQGESWRLTGLGQGDVPLTEALDLLFAANSGSNGAPSRPAPYAISVEWERAWHPHLDPPEVALPAALAALQAWLAGAGQRAGQPAEP